MVRSIPPLPGPRVHRARVGEGVNVGQVVGVGVGVPCGNGVEVGVGVVVAGVRLGRAAAVWVRRWLRVAATAVWVASRMVRLSPPGGS